MRIVTIGRSIPYIGFIAWNISQEIFKEQAERALNVNFIHFCTPICRSSEGDYDIVVGLQIQRKVLGTSNNLGRLFLREGR